MGKARNRDRDFKKGLNIVEIWKDIERYEWLYQISNYGRYKSFHFKKPKICKPNLVNGYLYARLYLNKKRERISIHRLVAIHFIANHENKPMVNHKDGNKQNNNINNLEWVTSRENINHAWDNGLRIYTEKQRELTSLRFSKKVYQLDIASNKIIREFSSTIEASKYIGCSDVAISNCCTLKCDTVKGYRWRYEDSLFEIKKINNKYNKKMIARLDNDGNIIKIYKSIKEASLDIGKSQQTICDYLKGRVKNKYSLKYIEKDEFM